MTNLSENAQKISWESFRWILYPLLSSDINYNILINILLLSYSFIWNIGFMNQMDRKRVMLNFSIKQTITILFYLIYIQFNCGTSTKLDYFYNCLSIGECILSWLFQIYHNVCTLYKYMTIFHSKKQTQAMNLWSGLLSFLAQWYHKT